VALLLIPLLWLLRKIGRGRFVPSTPLNVSLLLMLVMLLVSFYATFDIPFSFPKIAGIVYGVALFFAVAQAGSRSHRALWLAVGLLLLGGLGAGALSIIGAAWPSKLPVLGSVVARMPARLLSLPGDTRGFNPNEVAGVMLWVAPLFTVLAAALWLAPRRLRQQLSGGPAIILLIIIPPAALLLNALLVLTQSRAGVLGLAGALLAALFLALARLRPALTLGLALVAIIAGLVVLFNAPELVNQYLFVRTAASEEALGSTLNSLEGRREIWSRAIYGIQDFPITGMGVNTFRRVVPILYPLFLVSPDHDIAHAHNHLLQTALDLGLPGLIAYLALWLGAGVMLWQSWRRGQTIWLRALALGCFASLLGYFIYGLVDAVALGARPGFLFWYLLGVVAALYRVVDVDWRLEIRD